MKLSFVLTGVARQSQKFERAERRDIERNVIKPAGKAAAEAVRDEVRTGPRTPRRSGKLAKSAKASVARDGMGRVVVGSPGRVPYAGPIHFGWPARNIRPQPFVYQALDERFDDVMAAYETAVDELSKDLSTSLI